MPPVLIRLDKDNTNKSLLIIEKEPEEAQGENYQVSYFAEPILRVAVRKSGKEPWKYLVDNHLQLVLKDATNQNVYAVDYVDGWQYPKREV
jgi:hypothetical protein